MANMESQELLPTPWYNRKGVQALTHIVVWAIALTLPYLLRDHHHDQHGPNQGPYDMDFFYLNLITNFLWIGPFYLNAGILVPRLMYGKRYALYVLSLLAMYAAIICIHAFFFIELFEIPHFHVEGAAGFLIFPYLLTIAISTTYRMIRDKMEADRLTQQTQEEHLKTELSFLRSQINPHFIFNILNNLVALERLKSDELGPTILKLSSLMQYMLYDTDEDKVGLTKEVEYLQSYIDLQRQRFGGKVNIFASLDAPEGFYEIEPMLLIPFVENAFKHGVGIIEKPTIEISLHVQDNVLYFSVGNKFNDLYPEAKDKTSGIGLTNVKRRLNLLYGDQHTLRIKKHQDWFTVSLTLNLH